VLAVPIAKLLSIFENTENDLVEIAEGGLITLMTIIITVPMMGLLSVFKVSVLDVLLLMVSYVVPPK
jgi:hypothetical protein